MADVLLIICCVVAFVVMGLAGLYLLVYYTHPDDKNDAYMPKLTVITGFMLAGITVLMFPLDVANNEGYAGMTDSLVVLLHLSSISWERFRMQSAPFRLGRLSHTHTFYQPKVVPATIPNSAAA